MQFWQGWNLLLWRYVCDGAEAVILCEGVLVEQQPLRQTQLGPFYAVARQRMNLCYMFMGQNEVVPWSIHISCHLFFTQGSGVNTQHYLKKTV